MTVIRLHEVGILKVLKRNKYWKDPQNILPVKLEGWKYFDVHGSSWPFFTLRMSSHTLIFKVLYKYIVCLQ